MSLGLSPWCKLQALPIAGALGILVAAAIVRATGTETPLSLRVKQLASLFAGAVVPGLLIVVAVARGGAQRPLAFLYTPEPRIYRPPDIEYRISASSADRVHNRK
jgi:hypothetical protein